MKKIALTTLIMIFAISAAYSGECEQNALLMLQNIREGHYTEARKDFDKQMQERFSEQQMEQVWNQIEAQAGKYVSTGTIKSSPKSGMTEIIIVLSFERSKLDAKIYCDSEKKIAGFFLAPHTEEFNYELPVYAIPDNYEERDIIIGDGVDLKGKLTVPKGFGPFPCVVLVHGSGPNDMDETVGACKPFKDIALGLASRGIAVLRYDKRTYNNPDIDVETLTMKEEVIDDAVSAYDFAAGELDIDPERIFILGHSLGGMNIPRIATRIPDAAGFIAMAGSLRRLDKIVLDQYNYLFMTDGEIDDPESSELQKLNRQIENTLSEGLNEDFPADSLLLGAPAAYWKDYLAFDYQKAAEKIYAPMFIMQGGRDYQVTETDFELWKIVLEDKTNVRYKLYPNLNHLFVAGEGKSTPAEYNSPGHVDEEVILDIATAIMRM